MAAVVAYPTLADADRRWIEHVRARHDRQARRLGAHITLVFPGPTERDTLLTSVRAALEGVARIPFALGRAAPFADRPGAGCHVFLLVDEGARDLVAIHERLYEAIGERPDRERAPFVPHVTVGTCDDLGVAERLADGLNGEGRVIRGIIDRIDVVDAASDRVRSVGRVPLGATP